MGSNTRISYRDIWRKFEVQGVWKGAHHGFGCYAQDMRTGRRVAVVCDVHLPIYRGLVVCGRAVPAGDWHGTPMMRIEELLAFDGHDDTVAYMREHGFFKDEADAEAAWRELGRMAPYFLLSDSRDMTKLVRRHMSDANWNYFLKRRRELSEPNPVRNKYPFLPQAVCDDLLENHTAAWVMDALARNPYQLLDEGLRFRYAELVFFANGGAPDDPSRVDEVLSHALRTVLNKGGDTCLDASDDMAFGAWIHEAEALSSRADAAGALDVATLCGCVNDLIDGRDAFREVDEDGRYLFCNRALCEGERRIAEWAVDAMGSPALFSAPKASAMHVIERYYERNGIVDKNGDAAVDGYQLEAIMTALYRRLSVITGGPGRGKTSVAAAICDCWETYRHETIYLTSFTGRATARLAEAVGTDGRNIVAATMSSLLVDPRVNEYTLDGSLVIIDETSMVDVSVMGAFSRYLRGAQVVIIGDNNQLPSIGNGQVLRDIIESGAVPVTELTVCYRAKDSKVLVDNGDAIVEGRLSDVRYTKDFAWATPSGPSVFDDIVDSYVAMVTGPGALDPSEVCLLAAFKSERDMFSTVALNKRLRERLNPNGRVVARSDYYGVPLKVGDRVLITQNMRDIGVVNGDTGFIVSAYSDGGVGIELDNGCAVSIPRDRVECVELGYALTIHKSQGSEYRRVLVASSPRMMQDWARTFAVRNLMYTAITRAKNGVLLFGSRPAFDACLANEMVPRRTRLCAYICELCA